VQKQRAPLTAQRRLQSTAARAEAQQRAASRRARAESTRLQLMPRTLKRYERGWPEAWYATVLELLKSSLKTVAAGPICHVAGSFRSVCSNQEEEEEMPASRKGAKRRK
jgi:hypothetical protein